MRRSTYPYLLLLLIGHPGLVAAQAPVVSWKGDPSVNDSAMYALAVSPTDYLGHDYVLLFDDGIVRIEADGRRLDTYRQIAQVLTKDGAQQWAEQAFEYNPERQRFNLNWIRVRSLDGELLSDGPRHEQESPVAVPRDLPVYSDHVVKRLTLAGVTPGTLVDVSVTIETFAPVRPGDFSYKWYVNQIIPVLRSRFIVDFPDSVPPRIREENLGFERLDERVDDRMVLSWTTRDIPAIEFEQLPGFPNELISTIGVSGATEWNDIGRWYADLADDRYFVSEEIKDALSIEMTDAWTLDDSLRAAHRWVAQDFRYVSLSLGDGGYQPRYPNDVFASKFGDCKDKTTLFISLAKMMGLNAHPVLVNSDGGVDTLMPSLDQFDHMIAAIEHPMGHQYTDLTSALNRYGELPANLQAEPGLLVRSSGEAEVVRLPARDPDASLREIVIAGELNEDGGLVGGITVTATGIEQRFLRELLGRASERADDEMVDLAENITSSFFNHAVVDSTVMYDGYDLSIDPALGIWITVPDVLIQTGNKRILSLPLPDYRSPPLIAALEADEDRRFPIDVAEHNGPTRHRTELLLTLPPGWRAELPESVEIKSPFGAYRSLYQQQGNLLRAVRELSGRREIAPPDSVAAFVQWLNQLSQDRAEHIVIEAQAGIAVSDSLAAVELVEIGFAWPVGLTADVTSRRSKIKVENDERPDTTDMTVSYRMDVKEHDEGLLITFDEYQTHPDSDGGVSGTDVNSIIERSANFMPSYLVSSAGELLRVEGYEALINVLREAVQPVLDSFPEEFPGAEDFIKRALTEDYFLAKTAEEWSALVEAWAGAQLEQGVTYRLERDEPSPLYPDVLIPFEEEFTLESRVPCSADRADPGCVVLSSRSRPQPAAMKSLLTRIFGEMLERSDAAESYITDFELENTVTLVTEPQTLIPHRLEILREVSFEIHDSTGEAHSNVGLEHRTYEYRYGSASVARTDDELRPPLVAAAAAGNLQRVIELLEADGDIEVRDASGTSALIAAARAGHERVVRLLLYHGAQVDAADRSGVAAMLAAAEAQHPEIVARLVAAGGDADASYRVAREKGIATAIPALLAAGAAPASGASGGYVDSALTRYYAGSLEEALRFFYDAAAEDTTSGHALAWLAETHRRLGDRPRAVEAAYAALERHPCHSGAHATLGVTYDAQYGDWEKANNDSSWTHLVQAVDCDSTDGNAWLSILFTAQQRGEAGLERQALRHLIEDGFLTPATLAVSRWVLQSLPESALVLVAGDLDTYPALALQAVEGVRPDVAVVNTSLLELSWYPRMLRDRYGTPLPFTEAQFNELKPHLDERGRTVYRSIPIIRAWMELHLEGTLGRPLVAAFTAGDPAPLGGPGTWRNFGPYKMHATAADSAPVDPALVCSHFETLRLQSFRGPAAGARDRSPIRRNATTPTELVLGAALYAVPQEAWLDEQYYPLLVWGERFARQSEADAHGALQATLTMSWNEREVDSSAVARLAAAGQFARSGGVPAAIAAYREAIDLDSRLMISAYDWNTLCWYGALWGHATEVMEACEEAVALAPVDGSIRDSRGVARALVGDFEGAIPDLAYYAARTEDEQRRAERLAWVEELRAGRNPLTESVLQMLRNR